MAEDYDEVVAAEKAQKKGKAPKGPKPEKLVKPESESATDPPEVVAEEPEPEPELIPPLPKPKGRKGKAQVQEDAPEAYYFTKDFRCSVRGISFRYKKLETVSDKSIILLLLEAEAPIEKLEDGGIHQCPKCKCRYAK